MPFLCTPRQTNCGTITMRSSPTIRMRRACFGLRQNTVPPCCKALRHNQSKLFTGIAAPIPAGISVYPVQSHAGLLSGGNILLACGGAGAACPSGKIRAEGAAGHMDCADLTHGSACKARRALCAELSGSQYDALMKYQPRKRDQSGNNRPQVETAGTAESAECVRLCRITGVSNNRTTNPIGIVQHRTQAGETPAYRATILAFLHFHFGTNTIQ